ncbi:hypothetical protein CT0861_05890 [Colletotrichum tofieldiae]|uniref:Uncharacterized protein n=1 Tax=Colletotrichum tofieldiae TaxID=708197 RepID=A0A166YTN6_9PEZI|nr:hypothetical protein CT0861_05890 [Colletotrichum tofieldiae]GKT96552.1 hypothetical protein Ct61P_14402 [Colletotrichum tofieldiae]
MEELRQDAERSSRGEPCPACDTTNSAHLLIGEYWCDFYRLSTLIKLSFTFSRQVLGRAERWHTAQEKLRTLLREVDSAQRAVEWGRNNPRPESRLAEKEAHLKAVSEAFEKKKKYFYSITKTFAASLIEEELLEEEDLPEFLQRPHAQGRKRREAAESKAEKEAEEQMRRRLARRNQHSAPKQTIWTLHELKAMWESGNIPEEARGLITFTKEKPRNARKSAPRIKEEGGDGDVEILQPPTGAELEAAVAELYPEPGSAGRRTADLDASPWIFMPPGLPQWELPSTT